MQRIFYLIAFISLLVAGCHESYHESENHYHVKFNKGGIFLNEQSGSDTLFEINEAKYKIHWISILTFENDFDYGSLLDSVRDLGYMFDGDVHCSVFGGKPTVQSFVSKLTGKYMGSAKSDIDGKYQKIEIVDFCEITQGFSKDKGLFYVITPSGNRNDIFLRICAVPDKPGFYDPTGGTNFYVFNSTER